MKEHFSYEEAKKIWNESAPQIDSDHISRAYSHLSEVIGRRRRSVFLRNGLLATFAAACCVAAGIFIGGCLYPHDGTPSSPAYAEFFSGNGEVKDFVLADGTHVYLNSESSLTCVSDFENLTTRDIFLNGEAFFEVAKDTQRPFIVHAAGKSIKATGTKFNVRAFLDERSSTTTLLEGGVEITVPGHANPVVLTPGHALSVSGDNSEVALFNVDPINAVGWYKGEFNGYHMSLSQICRDLERKFDVKIMISNRNVASKVFYASFVNNEDVDQILDALNVQHDFRIRKQNKFYTIY